jgi:hypothetical protein
VDEDRKGIHRVFWVLIILDLTLHELDNDLRRAIGKREKVDMDVLALLSVPRR